MRGCRSGRCRSWRHLLITPCAAVILFDQSFPFAMRAYHGFYTGRDIGWQSRTYTVAEYSHGVTNMPANEIAAPIKANHARRVVYLLSFSGVSNNAQNRQNISASIASVIMASPLLPNLQAAPLALFDCAPARLISVFFPIIVKCHAFWAEPLRFSLRYTRNTGIVMVANSCRKAAHGVTSPGANAAP